MRFAAIILGLVASTASLLAQTEAAPTTMPTKHAWIRMGGDPATKSTLEIALRRFDRPDGIAVTLVGVAHVGEKSFYEALQQKLNTFDVVLYESVLPDGASRPEGSNDTERTEATTRSLKFLGDTARRFREEAGAWPLTIDELGAWAKKLDPRVGHGVRNASTDAWGIAITCAVDAATGEFTVQTTSRDGRPSLTFKVEVPTSKPTDK